MWLGRTPWLLYGRDDGAGLYDGYREVKYAVPLLVLMAPSPPSHCLRRETQRAVGLLELIRDFTRDLENKTCVLVLPAVGMDLEVRENRTPFTVIPEMDRFWPEWSTDFTLTARFVGSLLELQDNCTILVLG